MLVNVVMRTIAILHDAGISSKVANGDFEQNPKVAY